MNYELLFEKIELPQKAGEWFYKLSAFKKNNPVFCLQIDKAVELHKTDFKACDELLCVIGKNFDIEVHALYLYVQLLLCEIAYNEYEEKGIDIEYFYQSMSDICIRIMRAEKTLSVFGVDNFEWLSHFIYLTHYKIGRLEYCFSTTPMTFEYNGHKYISGEPSINIHIPSYQKFTHDDCLESYVQARAFFQKYYNMGNFPIFCQTWMIHPFLEDVLSEDSSIVKFKNDFHLISVKEDPSAPISWVFGEKEGNVDDYPQNTTLQRNVVTYLKNGGKIGVAAGLLIN